MTAAFNKKSVKLVIAVAGIYISYIYYGLILEKLYNTDYSGLERPKGSYPRFKFTFATSIFKNLMCFTLAALINRLYYKQSKSKMDLKSELFLAGNSFASGFLATQALSYVSFPLQSIMKSSKTISILAVSLIMGLKSHHTNSQYFCGVIITLGTVMFTLSSEKEGGSGEKDTSLIGVAAILVSVFCDGLLGIKQGEVKRKYNPTSWDQMESMNKWVGLLCVGLAIVSGQTLSFIAFVQEYPAVLKDLMVLSLLGTLGQVFIFYTIYNFSALLLSIVTTTRKLFTVLFSIFLYHHHLGPLQWFSIVLVFVGVFVETFGRSEGKTRKLSDPEVKEERDPEEKKLIQPNQKGVQMQQK